MAPEPAPAKRSLPLLTQSEVRTFRRCARERFYRYVMLRRSRIDAEPLSFGKFVHAELQRLWTTTGEVEHVPAPKDPFKAKTAAVLTMGYSARWGIPDGSLGAEIEFQTALTNPETGAPSKTYELAGKLDALQQQPDASVLVVEHKTTSEDIEAGSDYWKRLRIDTQISTYYVGARSLGYDVSGVLYDVIRKPTIRPRNTETPEAWGQRLAADITDRPDRYYARQVVVRLAQEEQEAAQDMWQSARNIADADRLGRHPKNSDACVRWGRTCNYFGVCTGTQQIADDYLFETFKRNEELSQ